MRSADIGSYVSDFSYQLKAKNYLFLFQMDKIFTLLNISKKMDDDVVFYPIDHLMASVQRMGCYGILLYKGYIPSKDYEIPKQMLDLNIIEERRNDYCIHVSDDEIYLLSKKLVSRKEDSSPFLIQGSGQTSPSVPFVKSLVYHRDDKLWMELIYPFCFYTAISVSKGEALPDEGTTSSLPE